MPPSHTTHEYYIKESGASLAGSLQMFVRWLTQRHANVASVGINKVASG